jgi:hypothetical protein
MAGPISPSEVDDTPPIPQEIWNIWNHEIKQNIEYGVAEVPRKDIIDIINNSAFLFRKRNSFYFLEGEYKKVGWIVETENKYDSDSSQILIFKKP